MANLNFQLIPAEVLEEASVKLNEVNQLLQPYLISLTVDQRVKMSKMGDKTYSFVVKSLEYAKQTPNLVPSYVDMEGFFIDLQNVNACKQVSIPVANLSSMLDDTMMQAGHEAYESALAFYNAVKIAAKNNVPGAKVIYDDLSQRFSRLGTKNGNGETEK
jgi:hypothetical protein